MTVEDLEYSRNGAVNGPSWSGDGETRGEREFWIALRRIALMFAQAIKKRYNLKD